MTRYPRTTPVYRTSPSGLHRIPVQPSRADDLHLDICLKALRMAFVGIAVGFLGLLVAVCAEAPHGAEHATKVLEALRISSAHQEATP